MTKLARPRDGVVVAGTDAASFLNGQLSQEVESLAVGATTWSFLLQPQGKVDAFLRVGRPGDDRFLLDVDAGWGEQVAARLNRFRLRVKADVDVVDLACVAYRDGEQAPVDGIASEPWWPGVDVLEGGDGGEGWEAARIEHAIPAMGAELDEKTIPAESGLVPLSVSFTKGCYTGQELVARIDSRGHVNRHLRRLIAPDGATIASGSDVVREGKTVGTVTSAAGRFGLGYVRREIDVPGEATVGDLTVAVEAVPFELA